MNSEVFKNGYSNESKGLPCIERVTAMAEVVCKELSLE